MDHMYAQIGSHVLSSFIHVPISVHGLVTCVRDSSSYAKALTPYAQSFFYFSKILDN